MTLVLNNDVPFPPHYSIYTLMNLKRIWMRPLEYFHAYLIWWLPFFSMLTMLFCSLTHDHAYKVLNNLNTIFVKLGLL
jgi:hypothetical protein